jgi:UDP-2,4-diacetamido-2,4,6-trideoxy-beta-L-altropyranose hydrolase
MKTVLFRADASIEMGSGHVMRCLTLARALRQRGWSCRFLCRDLPGHMMEYIAGQNFAVQMVQRVTDAPALPEAADWLVVDHYGFDSRSEKGWRSVVKHVLVISDSADRLHDCDILLDQNYHGTGAARYDALVPPHCVCLLGPRYALLRDEFVLADQGIRQRSGEIKRVLVFFGGSDPTGETVKTLRALQIMQAELGVDVVVGRSNPQAGMIEDICARLPGATFHCQTSHMAELMNAADLAIGAGGSATWERCWLGLPALVTVVADNQADIAVAVASTGATLCLGKHHSVTEHKIIQALSELLRRPEMVRAMSKAALGIMGAERRLGTGRVVRAMEEIDV